MNEANDAFDEFVGKVQTGFTGQKGKIDANTDDIVQIDKALTSMAERYKPGWKKSIANEAKFDTLVETVRLQKEELADLRKQISDIVSQRKEAIPAPTTSTLTARTQIRKPISTPSTVAPPRSSSAKATPATKQSKPSKPTSSPMTGKKRPAPASSQSKSAKRVMRDFDY